MTYTALVILDNLPTRCPFTERLSVDRPYSTGTHKIDYFIGIIYYDSNLIEVSKSTESQRISTTR